MRPCSKYTTAFISRFKDNEVLEQEGTEFSRHLEDCEKCAALLRAYQELENRFAGHLKDQAEAICKSRPLITPKKKAGEKKPFFSSLPGAKPYAGLYFKLASLACAALILVFALAPRQSDLRPDPSAVVNSIDTYGSSVMIIETMNTQHTIIWFSET